MHWNPPGITFKGYWTGDGWEIVVKRAGQRLRLLDSSRSKSEWALNLLTDYLGDEDRAADVHNDFAALTVQRFAGDWELTENDIEAALMEVEMLRAQLRIAFTRG